jgi:uncharacterized protein YegL
MKDNLTEVVFILDRSGSMVDLTSDTIGGFNSFIENQKQEPGEAILTTILFDDQYDIFHNGVDIKSVKPLTAKEYFARGMTALLDAIGKTINTVGERLNKTEEEDKPSKVIFVITTDGQENASREFTQPKIKEMIERQTKDYNWQFIFLGANIDAVSTAKSFGIQAQFSSNYTANAIGAQSVYDGVTRVVSKYREKGTINSNWKDDIK